MKEKGKKNLGFSYETVLYYSYLIHICKSVMTFVILGQQKLKKARD